MQQIKAAYHWLRRRICIAAACAAVPLAGLAQDPRQALIDQIVTAATNNTDEARHTVEINDCEMTTWVFKPYKETGFQVWSSFVFDMTQTEWTTARGLNYMPLIDESRDPKITESMVMIYFDMRGSSVARHEVPAFRKGPKSEYTPSPRQGLVPYFYHDSTRFFILHEGSGVLERAAEFTASYDRYVQEYCMILG